MQHRYSFNKPTLPFAKAATMLSSGRSLSSSARYVILIIITFTACILSILGLFHIKANPESMYYVDSIDYLAAARNIREYKTVYAGSFDEAIDEFAYSSRPPLYPLFIAICYRVWADPLSIIIVQIAIFLTSSLFLYKVAAILGMSYKYRCVIMALYMLHPIQLILTQQIMADTLFQFCILYSTWAMLRFLSDRKAMWLFHLDVVLLIAVFIKPALIYFWIINFALHAWLIFKFRLTRLILILTLLIPVATSLWSVRNKHQTGYYEFSSIKRFNLMYYANLIHTRVSGSSHTESFFQYLSEKTRGTPSYSDKATIEQREALFVLKSHLPLAILLQIKGMIHFFLDPGRQVLFEYVYGDAGPGILFAFISGGYSGILALLRTYHWVWIAILILLMAINTIICVFFILSLFSKLSYETGHVFMLLIIGYIVSVTGIIGSARYRLPVYPLILCMLPVGYGVLKNIASEILSNTKRFISTSKRPIEEI